MSAAQDDTGYDLTLELYRHFDARTITPKQMREYLQISDTTEWRMRRAGNYPKFHNIFGRRRITLIDFAEWLKSQRQSASSASEPKTKKRGRPVGSKNRNRAGKEGGAS